MKKIIYNSLFLFLVVTLFSSCITNQEKLYLQKEGRKAYSVVPFRQYRLNINDEIVYYLMTTSAETQALYNNSNNFRIYEDGCVLLPTIGRINIVGLTIREAEQVLTEKFRIVALDSEVKIALANNYFYVEGDGGKGQFPLYKENLNIFQAMALAGDISSIGDKSHIKIIRKGADGKDHIETFDLRKESIIESEYYYIRPNDVIYIPTNSKSFFRIESFSSMLTLITAPVSLAISILTYINLTKK